MTRKIKLVPNEKIRAQLSEPEFRGLDGEVIFGSVTDKDVFNRTQSAVMKVAGPDFAEADGKYMVFDDFSDPDLPFSERLRSARDRVSTLSVKYPWLQLVPHREVSNLDDLMNVEAGVVARGFEGVMVRAPAGRYKFGRSTLREGILLKIKRFADAEATIVGVEELYRNENEQVRNGLGQAERSSCQENLVAGDTMGALICESSEFKETFKIGTGFTAQQRAELWKMSSELIGQTVCFKYQPSGMKDLPRFPSYKGLRND